jgi:hypothetical protein
MLLNENNSESKIINDLEKTNSFLSIEDETGTFLFSRVKTDKKMKKWTEIKPTSEGFLFL